MANPIARQYKAVVLHSGGMDSTTCLAIAANVYGADQVLALSVDYGQRHIKEIECAKEICNVMHIDRAVIKVALPNSMLTDLQVPLPNVSYAELPEGVSPTYVPFRNGTFISQAAAVAQACGAEALYTGIHAEDAANWAYPDCTPEFFGGMATAVYVGTYHQVRLVAPLLWMSKAQVADRGFAEDAPLHMTWSCYGEGEIHCGTCPTCRARKAAFDLANIKDRTEYAHD